MSMDPSEQRRTGHQHRADRDCPTDHGANAVLKAALELALVLVDAAARASPWDRLSRAAQACAEAGIPLETVCAMVGDDIEKISMSLNVNFTATTTTPIAASDDDPLRSFAESLRSTIVGAYSGTP
ncbi:hypothetical protein ACQPZ2_21935 [Nocardia pseudovaccinii]|uniref:hypothetical protein n=1 Tax=Nocardia pseudovaccinii TaxID=189540 RepID=UPI003D8DA9BC